MTHHPDHPSKIANPPPNIEAALMYGIRAIVAFH